jgi:membrane associated rhomboid family serine protease
MVLPLGDLERTRIIPFVTYGLIAVNVVVFLYQQERGPAFTYAFAATPWEITHREDLKGPIPLNVPRAEEPIGPIVPLAREQPVIPHEPLPWGFPVWLTLLTAMFLHGSPLHLAGNMLYLWIFGDNVEEVLGAFWFLGFYLLCGLVGSLAQIVASPDSVLPTLGASGAIAGVMGAYVVWFPHHRIRVLVFRFLTEMPALMVVGLWIVLQIWLGLGSLQRVGEVGGVAYLAHVGGALTGVSLALALRERARAARWHEDRRHPYFRT